MELNKKDILKDIKRFMEEVIGDEWIDGEEISFETSIANDLEMESIEIVELAEKITTHYGNRVNFVLWMSTMDLDRIINLTVGEIVDFIDSCVNKD